MNRILIIAPNWIGDAVMSQPLWANLKACFPQSTIDVLASPWVAPIYRACSEVNDVLEIAIEHKRLQWNLRKSVAQKLQEKQYGVCFVLPNSLKSALIPWLANIPFRMGYRGELRYGLINFALPNPSKTNRPPMVEHYLALSSLLEPNIPTPETISRTPQLNVSPFAQKSIRAKLAADSIHENAIYVFCPGAEYGPTKRWPTKHFAVLANTVLTADPTAHIILLGSKTDHLLGEEVLIGTNHSQHIHNWCGATSLDEAIALIAACKILVSNDSGLMHIGAALKIPQVAIFGSSDPHHTPPLSTRAKIISLNMPCSPCHKRECPLGHLQCLNNILPQDVFHSIQSLR